MTPAEISLVRDSFRKILPRADQAVALFYARLFELDPMLRPMARGDMAEEGRKLMATMDLVIGALDRLEMAGSILKQVGALHDRWEAPKEHFATVGAALLWTLGKGLGPEFTPAVRDAWTNVYTTLANSLIAARQNRARTSGSSTGDVAA